MSDGAVGAPQTTVQRMLIRLMEKVDPAGPRFLGMGALDARLWIAARAHVLEDACGPCRNGEAGMDGDTHDA